MKRTTGRDNHVRSFMDRYEKIVSMLEDLSKITNKSKKSTFQIELPGQRPQQSIIVLPLTKMNTDTEQEYLCED